MLSEYPRGAVERGPEALTIGGSRIAWEGSTLVVRFAERAAVSGRAVEGTLRLTPSATFDEPLQLDARGRHYWWGVAPHSRVEVEVRRPRGLSFRGHAYHDANFGAEPLEVGFSDWRWLRARQEERTIVLYDSRRRDGSEGRIARVFGADGALQTIDAPQEVELGRSRWGVGRSTRCDAGGRAEIVRGLEDTPFYARAELCTDLGGARSSAVYESLDLDRFKRPLVRHMLGYKTRVEPG